MIEENKSPLDSAKSSGAEEILTNKDTDIIMEVKTEIELKSGKLKAIPFPIEVFPAVFKDVIIATNEALNFPTDYSAACILTAVATAIGKTAVLEVKNGWKEFCP